MKNIHNLRVLTPSPVMSESHLVLGPASFTGLESCQVQLWRAILRSGQPELVWHFALDSSVRIGVSYRPKPGVVEGYDIFVVWNSKRHRLAIGRHLFTIRGRLTFLAFIYPTIDNNNLEGTFGTVDVSSTITAYGAFEPERRPKPHIPWFIDTRVDDMWMRLAAENRYELRIAYPESTLATIPHPHRVRVYRVLGRETGGWMVLLSSEDRVIERREQRTHGQDRELDVAARQHDVGDEVEGSIDTEGLEQLT